MSDCRWRYADRSDIPFILDVLAKFESSISFPREKPVTAEDIQEWVLDKKSSEIILALDDQDNPVGYALFFERYSMSLGRTGLHVSELFVLPHARKQGFGDGLLNAVATIALERKYARIEWLGILKTLGSRTYYRYKGAALLDDDLTYRLAGRRLQELADPEVRRRPVPSLEERVYSLAYRRRR